MPSPRGHRPPAATHHVIEIDGDAWLRELLRQLPEGSDAHLSYFDRITRGPDYAASDAIRVEE